MISTSATPRAKLPGTGLIPDLRSNPGRVIDKPNGSSQLFTSNEIGPARFALRATILTADLADADGASDENRQGCKKGPDGSRSDRLSGPRSVCKKHEFVSYLDVLAPCCLVQLVRDAPARRHNWARFNTSRTNPWLRSPSRWRLRQRYARPPPRPTSWVICGPQNCSPCCGALLHGLPLFVVARHFPGFMSTRVPVVSCARSAVAG